MTAGETPEVIAGGGEMGARIRAHDWTGSVLGPMDSWPQSLRTVLRVLLNSRYAMWLGWGEPLTFFCNDAYFPTLGQKGARALGERTEKVWEEIWSEVGPRIERVFAGGGATYDDGLMLFLERNGYPEETYHTFSYSPAPDDLGNVGGLLCVVAEETERVLGERRLATLASLAAELAGARTEAELWDCVVRGLEDNPRDLPFALLFLFEPGSGRPVLAGAAGVAVNDPFVTALVGEGGAALLPKAQDLAPGLVELPALAEVAAARGVALPSGTAWQVPPRQAAALPIAAQGAPSPLGFVLAGINPFRPFDDAYADFLRLTAGQIAAGLASVRAYEEERRRAEALAELDRSKTLFFSNVSHELRTPLTLMMAPLEDALNDVSGPALPEALRQRLDLAHRNSLRLLRLVNSLLDFSRIEAGRLQGSFQATDLAALTGDLASGFRSAAERAGLYLRTDCTTFSEPVYVDRDMWERITLNLLSNAFKFTFQGGISVFCRIEQRSAVLRVADTGVGIPAEELPRIFERFHRVEGQQSRSFEGSGIGLALTQELVRLHGGTITAESEPGKGTTFTVTVPLGRAHLPAGRVARELEATGPAVRTRDYVQEALRWLPDSEEAAKALAPPENGGHDESWPLVLVADDNADMRDYIARLLGQRYRVTAAADGSAALESLRRERPDLVLSDVMMPNLDGFGLLAEIRADPALRALPVILVSARAGEDARSEGLDAGADDYLTKPFSARELLARVGANLAMARLREESSVALRARTAELETVLATVPLAVWFTYDPAARHVQGNDAAAALLRMPREANPSLSAPPGERPEHYRVLRDGAELDAARMPLQRAARGETVADDEIEIRFDDGSAVTLLVQARPFLGPDGEELGAVSVGTDVTGRKLAESALRRMNEALEDRIAERTAALVASNQKLVAEMAERGRTEEILRQSQKMEAVGQLTGGLAHDFNNLLTGIVGSLELLQARAAQGRVADVARYVSAARGAADRAAALTHRLLAFSRRQTLEPKAVDANRLIGGMEDLIRRTMGPAVQLNAVKAGGLWTTCCDPNQLENVLLNLCINARDAMPDGGRLTIETENAYLDAREARIREIEPGQYVGIHVTDTGAGMPPEVRERAFDPFFTTKPIGKGTGLGLSMTYGFARQSGGQVRIYSEVGQGTTIKLYLPRHHGEAAALADGAAERADQDDLRAHEGETVLVVDDEPTVRMLVVEVLGDLGYRAIEAEDAASGLRALERAPRIDLLVTDVGLPGGMNGRQLADAARAQAPGLKVLFITGYAENAVFGNGILEHGMQVIAKPFAMEVLATRIRAMIAGR